MVSPAVEESGFELTRVVSSRRSGRRPARAKTVGALIDGKYRLERLIGKGAMGAVFEAHHELLGRRVALKLIAEEHANNPDAARRFLNEARAAAGIENEHVARILDAARLEDGAPYMVLEMLEGEDLAQILDRANARKEPLGVTKVVDWILQAIEGLAEAHALGIVHRDLKPANLFLARRRDGTSILKVIDFGISKAASPLSADPSLTSTRALLGSPVYMPPEQLRDARSVDARADIWSLGVVLYELLSGDLPFYADNVADLFVAVLEGEVPSLRARRSDVPPDLEAVILRCLRREVAERHRDVAELAEALAPFGPVGSDAAVRRIRHLVEHASRPSRVSDAPPRRRRSLVLGLVAAMALGAAAAFGLVESGVVSPPAGAAPARAQVSSAPLTAAGATAR
ncbi:MAG TPA: serine/threonine-protein kinase [Polyangiaceae bacterium]|jgi:serine/threonine-protein kinase|nr:serine/threonine-protein kinase [Polyangiaceae bacterium]